MYRFLINVTHNKTLPQNFAVAAEKFPLKPIRVQELDSFGRPVSGNIYFSEDVAETNKEIIKKYWGKAIMMVVQEKEVNF